MPGVAAILAGAWAEGEQPAEHTPKFSFEYFPPRTPAGVEGLYNRVYRMGRQGPLFIDLTWGAGGSTSALTLEMSTNFKKLYGLEVNMHLTCTNITQDTVHQALIDAKANGITSIVALRGDPPLGTQKWAVTEGGFACGLDLVRFIRKEHGDHFSISVSGYPEGHPDVIKPVADESKLSDTERARLVMLNGQPHVCSDEDYVKEIQYLKAKVDAGASVIITQLFFEADLFLGFVDTCRAAGITVPILPGIMALEKYGGFSRMTGMCKTRVPEAMRVKAEEFKDDDAKFAAFGVEYLVEMCKQIWASNKVPALHFYCLNQHVAAFEVLAALGVPINHLDSPEDHAKVEEVAHLIKTSVCAPKREAREQEVHIVLPAQKKARTEASEPTQPEPQTETSQPANTEAAAEINKAQNHSTI